MKIGSGATVKLFHLYPEGGPAPPMTSSICVFHLGISLVPFPLEYALYQIPGSPARRSRASWNPQLEVTFQYR